jgi:protein ImuB
MVLPPAFESRLELHARADTTEQVLHGTGVLVERLIAWLGARHAFVRRFRLLMQHEPRWRQDAAKTPSCTALEIALADPSRDRVHLLMLLRERLGHLRLAAPTLELCLYAEDIVRRPAPNTELFPTPRNEQEGLVRLVERLQARLGAERVQRLAPGDDHRPERACTTRPADPATIGRGGTPVGGRRSAAAEMLGRMAANASAGGASTATSAGDPILASSRPVWLLPEPEPLGESRWTPLLAGRPLALLAGPERIEAGWWDGALAERDYFIAEGADGALVWIYRARLPLSREEGAPVMGKGWYLHGRFG